MSHTSDIVVLYGVVVGGLRLWRSVTISLIIVTDLMLQGFLQTTTPKQVKRILTAITRRLLTQYKTSSGHETSTGLGKSTNRTQQMYISCSTTLGSSMSRFVTLLQKSHDTYNMNGGPKKFQPTVGRSRRIPVSRRIAPIFGQLNRVQDRAD